MLTAAHASGSGRRRSRGRGTRAPGRARCSRSETRACVRAGRRSPPRRAVGTGRRGSAPRARPRRPGPARGCGSRRRSRRRPRPGARPASRSARRSPAARDRPPPCNRSGSSRRPTRAWREPLHQDVVGELLGALVREPLVEWDHHELIHAEIGDQLGFGLEARKQLGGRLRADHLERMGLEREHRVAAADHLAVPEVDAVELADRHSPRSLPDLGEHRHLHRRRRLVVSARGHGCAVSRAGRRSAPACPPGVARRAPRGRPRRSAAPPGRRRRPPGRRSVPRSPGPLGVQTHLGQECERLVEADEPLGIGAGDVKRPDRACGGAPRSTRPPGRRSGCARRCPTSTRS